MATYISFILLTNRGNEQHSKQEFCCRYMGAKQKTAHLQKTDPTFYFRFSKHPKKYTKNSLYIYLILIGVDNGMGPKP
jgi:hypothetical protein